MQTGYDPYSMANGTIQSLERGLSILTILAKSARPMSLNEVAAYFSIDRSSVFRLIKTMVKNGFIAQDADTKRYTLGFKILELAGALNDNLRLEESLRPLLQEVCAETRQNTHLAILDEQEVVFVAVEQPRDAITLSISIGTREPATHTALGRALLAFADPAQVDRVLSAAPFTRYTAATVTRPDDLRRILSEIRRDRLAFDNEEYRTGITCFASPVFDHRSRAICSIGISGTRDLILPHREEYARIIRQAGMKASALLGHPPSRET